MKEIELNKDYYLKQEVQEMFNLGRVAFDNWRKEGLKISRIGRRTIIKKAELERFINRYQIWLI